MADELEPRGNQGAVLRSDAACTTVDAGAGTGKTTTMLLKIESLIEAGVDPGEVLVLTFANEAAANIRSAIRDRLDPATAASIDVHTYHSLCYRLVREYAYHLGRDPDLEVITEHRRRRRIEQLLVQEDYPFVHDETGASGIGEVTDDIEQFIARLSREDVDPETVLERLPDAETLASLDQLARDLEAAATRRVSFDEQAFRYFSSPDHLETAREAVRAYGKVVTLARDRLAAGGTADPIVADIVSFLDALATSAARTRSTLSLEDKPTRHLPRALYANEIHGDATRRLEQTPAGRLTHYLQFLREARQYATVYRDYRESIAAAGGVDFDELVRMATRLVGDETVRDGILDRWAWICCDEFQDTDVTQFDLLTTLTGADEGPRMLAIGDTDQAIYGWRGTDPAGLARLGDAHRDHEAVALDLNFRSPQPILDVANSCDYGPQSSKRLRADRETAADTTHVVSVESDDVGLETPAQVARMVTMLLNDTLEGVPRRSPGDIGIVVRTNEQARQIGEALSSVQLPHTITGSPRGTVSPGIQTLLSYLRVLVDPAQDRHLRRVLLARYRIGREDLERLQAHDGSLFAALEAVPSSDLAAPDRVERAHQDVVTLRETRRAYPLSTVIERFLERTRIEWYLRPDERADVERLHRFVELHEREAVLSRLSAGFVDGLRRSLQGSRPSVDRGSRSPDRIDVMTVHQAKGLEFDTVLVPFCSDEHWCHERDYAERSRYDMLAAALDPTGPSPLLGDLATESVREEWRVFHVAITRAANHLLLFGSPYDYEGAEGIGVSTADRCLPDTVNWSTAGERMDLWTTVRSALETVQERHPESVADRTAALADAVTERPGRITYYTGDRRVEPLETREAVETVHELGRLLRSGTLLPAADAASVGAWPAASPTDRHLSSIVPEASRFPVGAITTDDEVPPARQHSHSALATHERCPRKHYLDHVVRAYPDSQDTAGTADRTVGTVFHDVAEEAHRRGYDDRATWRRAAKRHCTARDLTEHTEAILACVDRYFQIQPDGTDQPLHEWPSVAAELPFELADVTGIDGSVVGYVDALYRRPDGGIVVIDYKATAERLPLDEATQLSLYAVACERELEVSVEAVGYAYVGDAGPGAAIASPDEVPAWPVVRERLAALETPRFEEYRSGSHCRTCPHQSLGCAPDDLGGV